MKKTLLILAMALIASIGIQAQNTGDRQGRREMPPRISNGVGPVVAASMNQSNLPEASQAFLNKYFAGAQVVGVKNDFRDRRYEVRLSDGCEVDFDYNGNWIEVDAPDGATLPSSTLSALMPESAVTRTLAGDAITPGGVTDFVEEVVSYPDFYVVQTNSASGQKTRSAVSRTDGGVQLLKAKAPRGDRQGKGYKAKKDRNRDRRDRGDRPTARLDVSPRLLTLR